MNKILINETIIYFIIRTLSSIGNLWLCSLLFFGIIQLTPGDYCTKLIFSNPNISQKTCQEIMEIQVK